MAFTTVNWREVLGSSVVRAVKEEAIKAAISTHLASLPDSGVIDLLVDGGNDMQQRQRGRHNAPGGGECST